MTILSLIGSIGCILFFGLGFFVLFAKKNYKYAFLSLIFVFAGAWMLLDISKQEVSNEEVTINEEYKSKDNVSIENKKAEVEAAPNPSKPKLNSDADDSEKVTSLSNSIQKAIDADFTFKTSIKEITLNKHAGTEATDDYIALVYLSYDQPHSEETSQKWIETYTSHLAAKLAENTINIQELAVFWETPRFKKDWNSAKFTLLKGQDSQFYFEETYLDNTVFE